MLRLSICCILLSLNIVVYGQDFENYYDEDNLNESTFQELGEFELPPFYAGEFFITLENLYSNFDGIPANANIEYLVEVTCVGLPFAPDVDYQSAPNRRWLTVPDQNSIHISANQGYSEESYAMHLIENRNFTRIYRTTSDYIELVTLISGAWNDLLVDGLLDPDNAALPHSVLRIRVSWSGEPNILERNFHDFYVNLSRGKMTNYPFMNNFTSGSNALYYDVVFSPKWVFAPSASWIDDSNDLWYDEGTINYFPQPDNCGLNFPCENSLNEELEEYNNPPPYTLWYSPMMDLNAAAFAGFTTIDGSIQDQELQPSFSTSDLTHHRYFVDKPFDWRLINPDEAIGYLPYEMTIGEPISDAQFSNTPQGFNGVDHVFPSGYTLFSGYGKFPTRAAYEQELLDGDCENILDCFPPTDLTYSIVHVQEGSVLTIEDCVRLEGVHVVVHSGGALVYNPDLLNGNYTIEIMEGGTENISTTNAALFCSNCNDPNSYDQINFTTLLGENNISSDITIQESMIIPEGSTVNIEPNTTLYFGPHARLIVEPGGVLNASNVVFKNACSSMWTGIELHSNDILEASINLSNCSIQNAHIGILDAEPAAFDLIVDGEYDPMAYLDGFTSESWGADIVLDGCSFDACGIGFMHPNFEVLLPEIQDFQITNCTFSCPEYGLLDAQYLFGAENAYPNNQYPWYGLANSQKRSFCGVLIAGARGPSLGTLDNGNIFENLEIGVRCFRSSVDVVANNFDNTQYGVHYSNFGRYWNHTPGIKITDNFFININDPSNGSKNSNVLNSLELSEDSYIELTGDQSAGIRIEGVGNAYLFRNFMDGSSNQMSVGVYLMNCNDLIVEGNDLNNLGFGVILVDGESRQPGNTLIGPNTDPEFRNVFQECHTAFVAIGDNREVLFRCNNLIHDFNYSGNSWVVGGVLKDQGYVDDPNVSWTGAGNLFFSNEGNHIASEFIEFENLNLEYQSTMWNYYYADDDISQLIPEEGINLGTLNILDMEDSDVDVLEYDPIASCIRPYKHFEIQGLPSVKNLWLETKVDIEGLELAQDEFQQKTSELLTAIYGGIQNELELKQFLIDHIPLSKEVIKQYMLKEDTPAEYFKDVIELNGELEKELLDIAKSKTAYLPEDLKQEIMGLATYNSLVESTQELKSRAEVMETVMYDLVKAEMQDGLATPSTTLGKLPEELRNTYLDAWIEVSSLSTTVSELRTKYPTSLNDDQLEWMMELVVESGNNLKQSSIEKRDSLYSMTQNYLLDENATWALSVLDYRWSTPLYTLDLDLSKSSSQFKHRPFKELDDIDQLNLFPNPAQDWMYIESEVPLSKISIYNSNGQLVREINNLSDDSHTLFVGDLEKGLYHISINDDQNLAKSFLVK